MKFTPAFIAVPLAFSQINHVAQQKIAQPVEQNPCASGRYESGFVEKISKRSSRLSVALELIGDEENERGRFHRFIAQELLLNFVKGDLKRLRSKYEDGADPQLLMDEKGNTMAHLIMNQKLGADQPKDYLADNLSVLMQLAKNGYDFNTKNKNGLTAKDVAMLNGNREFALMSDNIQKMQEEIPDNESEMNKRMYNFALQENPSKKAKEIMLKLIQRGVNIDEGQPGETTTTADEVISNWDENMTKSFFQLREIANSIAHLSSRSKVFAENITDHTNDLMQKELFKWRNEVSKFYNDGNNERYV